MNILLTTYREHDAYKYWEMTDGKKSAWILQGRDYVTVCAKNATHRAWRGLGKNFENFDQAKNGYRSAFMRGAIELAANS